MQRSDTANGGCGAAACSTRPSSRCCSPEAHLPACRRRMRLRLRRSIAAAVPPDGPPGPVAADEAESYCIEVGVLPGTDFRLQPKYMDMLDMQEAWQFGRGAGVKVAVIDTGVTPHPRFPHLIAGGDYVMAGRRVVGLRRPRHDRGVDDRCGPREWGAPRRRRHHASRSPSRPPSRPRKHHRRRL